ncbi:MAG TPA: SAM-dependent methyltransferase [Pyrinomonadaceae bacterium]|nr:SAM-dependent methyltransferase [Pyrinomonadaceae bacterium]
MADSDAEDFFRAFEESLGDGSFVKLTLGKYRGAADVELKNVYVRPVEIKGQARLSFLYRFRTKDTTKNYTHDEGRDELRRLLGVSFLSGHLFTLKRNLQLEYNRKLKPRLIAAEPSFKSRPVATHDQRKRRFIEPENNVYLRALGVTNERSEVRASMSDKFRQINRFVEIVAGLHASSALASQPTLSVVDMGSGKGYLTFAVYDYLNRGLGLQAHVTGVEARAELVELCNRVAVEAGFERLQFRQGYIDDFSTEDESTDILIALHACDTATDDALFKGISAAASIVICAPCCHKEVRPQIEAPEVLRPVLRHGILLERQAEMLTDALRALLLEYTGYATKVFEFISTEHTAKNVMLTGVRRPRASFNEEALRQFRDLKNFYGLRTQRLERLLFDPRAALDETPAHACDPA